MWRIGTGSAFDAGGRRDRVVDDLREEFVTDVAGAVLGDQFQSVNAIVVELAGTSTVSDCQLHRSREEINRAKVALID